VAGAILACLSITLLVAQRITATRITNHHAARAQVDMSAIAIQKHYKITQAANGLPALAGPDGFWVAELVEEGQSEGQVVGCVGLGELPYLYLS
jgi:hypothetical protein